MPINKFTTLLDLSRQAKIITGETATFDGKILAGIPFSGYPTGVNTATTVSLGVVSTENAVFSGNTGTTVFDVSNPLSPYYNPLFSGYTATTWTNPLFSATTSGLTLPITILSADTQVVGPFWTLTQTGYTGDYIIGTEYTGYSVTYSFFTVTQFSAGVFSGITSASQQNFSAGTLDYKGPLDYLSSKENISVDGRLITNKITITNGASSATTNYVLSQIDDTGKGGWNSVSSLLSGSCLPIVNLETINDCSSGITFNSDVIINGDVIVNGSATTINTEIIRSKDNNIILNYSGTHLTAIGGGFTLEDGVSNGVNSRIYSDSNGVWLFDPSLSASSGTIINFSADTIGSSGDCVNDLYVSNIHSCSPLNINPLDEGNVYFGSTSGVTIDVTNSRVGIGTDSPQYSLDVVNTNSRLYYDPTSFGGLVVISGNTNIPRFGITIAPYLTKPVAGGQLGMRAWDDTLTPGYGKVGDMFTYAGNASNGLNLINSPGSGTEDYIRFYAGQTANGTTPDLHIQGSGVTRGYVGIGTSSPTERLTVSGTSFFKTSSLTTGTSPSFYYLDGVSTPTDTTTIKSIYKEFRPTTTSSSIVVGDGTLLYPNITSPTNGEFYSKANLLLYTDNLSLLNNTEALTSEINVVQIQTNTGTYNDIVKSSSSVLRNLTAGGTINKYVGFWMNGFDIDFTHNGTTNNIYGFYMDDQSTRSGNIPPTSNRWGIYIDDDAKNYFAGSVGIGTINPSEKLHISSGDMLVENTNGKYYTDIQNTTGPLTILSGNSSGVSRIGVIVPTFDSVTLGVRGPSAGFPGYGKQGDAFIYSSGPNNGFNLISAPGTGTDDYIRFYAGINATSTPDLHIQGSGATRGYVGIGTVNPSEKLDVNGKTKTTTLQVTSGSINGYVLVSDSVGNATWQSASGATSGVTFWTASTGVDAIVVKNSGSVASGLLSLAQGYQTTASGDTSHAEGYQTIAGGNFGSHAEGYQTTASGDFSHAEGADSTASGVMSHAEGYATNAFGDYSHTEGNQTTASGNTSHAEGNFTLASGSGSHAEGDTTIASGISSHAEGADTLASGNVSHAEGATTLASGYYSHAEGNQTSATTFSSHAEGEFTLASGISSHAEGGDTLASGSRSHAEGILTISSGQGSHAEGYQTSATTSYSHSEGYQTLASGFYSHSEGYSNIASGVASHAEGGSGFFGKGVVYIPTSATSYSSHAEGIGTLASGSVSHAEGRSTTASGPASHSEGISTTASGDYSHAEGYNTLASGGYSHAEGSNTLASGGYSHSEGISTFATANGSHAEGYNTFALGVASHAEGGAFFDGIGLTSAPTSATTYSSHAEGLGTLASGQGSHAEGFGNIASGVASHAEGGAYFGKLGLQSFPTSATTYSSHAEGINTLASGQGSHAEGESTESLGAWSHSEGQGTTANGTYSHSEGGGTFSNGTSSHAEGINTNSGGNGSHAEGVGTLALGQYSHAEGAGSISSGTSSHAEGALTLSLGDYSHSEGSGTTASGIASHAEGYFNISSGIGSHAEGGARFTGKGGLLSVPTSATSYSSHSEGTGTLSSEQAAHAEGSDTVSSGFASHSEGGMTNASGQYSHAEGESTLSTGVASHAEGYQTSATTQYSHAEGADTLASGVASHAEGDNTLASGNGSHSEGVFTISSGLGSHAEGFQTSATTSYSHAEGADTLASGFYSHSEGYSNIASGFASHAEGGAYFGKSGLVASPTSATTYSSHAEGIGTLASGIGSHAEGNQTLASGVASHAEGAQTLASGGGSHAEGLETSATASYTHAEGYATSATTQQAHAEGNQTLASGIASHAEGDDAVASGTASHAEGAGTLASSSWSHAEGIGTIAYEPGQHVSGRYNNITNANQYFIIGNGISNASRSNAFRVDSAGNVYGAGATYNSGADYAEYFESLSGDSIPYGTVVELVDDKIKVCVDSNNAMGVISSNPTLIGNNEGGTADEWVGKYEKDEWGKYIMEDYSYDMIDYITESGETIYKTITEQRSKLSQNFDPNLQYIPRSQRSEWNVVGLVGQVRVLKNQQIPSRWIKMKDINNDIALYLIR